MTAATSVETVRGYRVVRPLGRGGLATTFEAVKESTGERVALKRLAVARVGEWKALELFEREAAVLARVHHSAIPRYIEHFTEETADGPTLYLVQELVVGSSVGELVRRGALAPDEPTARRIAEELLAILDYLGRQAPPVIHRDIKPENILRRSDGAIVLVDFGAARGDAGRTEGGSTTVGTYGYMAPEQLHGVATAATDLYGLGCTLLFVLTGQSPTSLPRRQLHIDVEAALAGRISSDFQTWLKRMVEPSPDSRFASAPEALSALHGKTSAGRPLASAPRGSRARTLALAAVLVVLSGVALGVAWHDRPIQPATARAHTAAPATAADLPPRWTRTRLTRTLSWDRVIPAHTSAVFSVAVSSAGDRIASSSNDGTVKLWETKTGAPVRSLLGHTGRVAGVAFTPDGTLVASAGDNEVLVQNAVSGAIVQTLDARAQTTALDISPDGKRVIAGTTGATLLMWDIASGKQLVSITAPGRVLSAHFSPDGRQIATAAGHTVTIWDAVSGVATTTLPAMTADADAVAWSPDGKILATVADDHVLRTWLVQNGQAMATAIEAGDELWTVAFDPRGQYVAAAGKEGMVRVYEAMTGKYVAMRAVDTTGALSLAWTPEASTIVVGTGHGQVIEIGMSTASRADNVPAIPHYPAPSDADLRPGAVAYRDALTNVTFADDTQEAAREAEKALRAVLVAEPKNPLVLVGIAYAMVNQLGPNRTKESLAAADAFITRALELDPALSEAHIQRARIDLLRKDSLAAKDEAVAAETHGQTGRSQLLLADLAFEAGADEDAEKEALHAIELGPGFVLPHCYYVLEKLYVRQGDGPAIEKVYDRIFTLLPTSASARAWFAERLLGLGQYDRAIEMAEASLKFKPTSSARRTLARGHAEKGADALWINQRPAIAKEEFDHAVVIDPTYPIGYYALGAYFRSVAVEKHDASLLKRSNEAFEKAAALDKKLTIARDAREDNDKLVALVSSPKPGP